MRIDNLNGQILLATPALQDPDFKDTVVLICNHNDEGSLGLIINRPRNILVGDVLEDLDLLSDKTTTNQYYRAQAVYEGGPMDSFRGFLLHDGWDIYDSTMQINPELHLTASRDALEALACGNGPEHYMLILGYAGWDAGQLEQELAENSWLIAPASHHILFQEPPESRWDFAARCMGIKRSHLSSQIGHA
ncbi:MAG: YqgE/AlgH family protein [Mariprofundus sp.]